MSKKIFEFNPIGYVRCPELKSPEDHFNKDKEEKFNARIELDDEFSKALADLAGFDRLWILFVFDRNIGKGYRLKVNPRPDPKSLRGMFATRTPFRPNPVGLSCVSIDSIENNIINFKNSDIFDGTPVIDIKPYIPDSDSWPDAKAGWLDNLN